MTEKNPILEKSMKAESKALGTGLAISKEMPKMVTGQLLSYTDQELLEFIYSSGTYKEFVSLRALERVTIPREIADYINSMREYKFIKKEGPLGGCRNDLVPMKRLWEFRIES